MKKELVHFVEWKKIPEEKVGSTPGELKEWGVRNIVAHPCWFRNGKEKYVEKMRERLEKFGIASPATHALRGAGCECMEEDPATWQEMIRKHKAFMEELSILGVTTYTLHLGFTPTRDEKKSFEILRKTVDALLPCGEKTGMVLALENSAEPIGIIEKVTEMGREYKNPFVGMCFDCGHANCYQTGVKETLSIMKEEIVTCHLHDNYGNFDDHNPPGKGNISWQELSAALETLPRLRNVETESGEWGKESRETFTRFLG